MLRFLLLLISLTTICCGETIPKAASQGPSPGLPLMWWCGEDSSMFPSTGSSWWDMVWFCQVNCSQLHSNRGLHSPPWWLSRSPFSRQKQGGSVNLSSCSLPLRREQHPLVTLKATECEGTNIGQTLYNYIGRKTGMPLCRGWEGSTGKLG